jgi:pimeloyl-ACP methyl ester carboxylesterase
MATATFQRAPVEYVCTGQGPGLVLVHGTAGDATTTWGPVVEALSDRFTLVAPNLPGSGTTPPMADPADLQAVAGQVVACARDAGLERFALAGYSLGAAVAAQLAADQPELVDSLLLVAGWVRTDPPMEFMLDLWRRLFAADRELFVRFVLHTGMSPEFFRRLNGFQLEGAVERFVSLLPDGVDCHLALDATVDLTAALPKIDAPTRVVGLTDDRIVPIHHARALAAGIDGADVAALPGGHLFPWEHPEAFLYEFERFAERVSDQS